MPDRSTITKKLNAIAEALIKRDMLAHGYTPAAGGGYLRSGADATNDPDNPVAPGWVPGPDGAATGTVPTGTGFAGVAGEDFFDPTADVYRHWPQWVGETFEPYLGAPEPEGFRPLVARFSEVTGLLAVRTVADDRKGEFRYEANSLLVSWLSNGVDDLGDLEGRAMDAFRRNYWGRLEPLVERYSLAARMLWVVAEGQATLWENYWKDLDRLVDGLPGSIEYPNSGDLPWDTISTILSLGSKLPVVGAAAGAAGEVVSTLQDLDDLMAAFGHEKRRAPYDMPTRADGCAEEVQRLLRELSDDARNQEVGLATRARDVREAMLGPGFWLERPGAILDADGTDDVVQPGTGDDLVAIRSDIQDARRALDDVAGVLRGAADRVATESTRVAFDRPAPVGDGPLGPYDALDDAADMLAHRCDTAATVLRQVGEVLEVVQNNFERTDDVVRERLERLENEPVLTGDAPGRYAI